MSEKEKPNAPIVVTDFHEAGSGYTPDLEADLLRQLVPKLSLGWEPWRYVGAVGDVQYENNWVSYSAAFQGARFRRSRDGKIVALDGLVSRTVALAASTMFTLPVGFRPILTSIFEQGQGEVTGALNAGARVDVTPSGTVQWVKASTSIIETDYTSLAGIFYWTD